MPRAIPIEDIPKLDKKFWISGCSGKVSYTTRKLALKAATTANKAHGGHNKIYACKNCSLWHLTTHGKHDYRKKTVSKADGIELCLLDKGKT